MIFVYLGQVVAVVDFEVYTGREIVERGLKLKLWP